MKRLLVALVMVMLFAVGVRAQEDDGNKVTVIATQFMMRQLKHDSTDAKTDTNSAVFIKPWTKLDSMFIDIIRKPFGRLIIVHNNAGSAYHTTLRPKSIDSTNWANVEKGFLAIDEEGIACVVYFGMYMDGTKDYRGESNYYYIKIAYNDILICYIYDPAPVSPPMDR